MASELSDAQLVEVALEAAHVYRGVRIREVIPGVTEHDVSRWRGDGLHRLTKDKRRALIAFVQTDGAAEFLEKLGLRLVSPAEGDAGVPAGQTPGPRRTLDDYVDGPAEQIIQAFTHPNSLILHPEYEDPKERVAAALAAGVRRGLRRGERQRLYRWADRELGEDET